MHILLDMDDVLIKSSFMNKSKELDFYWTQNLEKELGVRRNTLNLLFNEEWNDVILGKKSIYEQVNQYLASINASVSAEKFILYWVNNDSILNSEMVSFAMSMHAKGWKLCIGANQENVRVNYIMEKHKSFFSLFEKIFTSASLGVKKPNRDFFRFILTDLNMKAEDLVFVDDKLDNVEVAKELGIRAFQYKSSDEQLLEMISNIYEKDK